MYRTTFINAITVKRLQKMTAYVSCTKHMPKLRIHSYYSKIK